MEIKKIIARQIFDSRGCPTVEADVFLENGAFGRAAVPSGASTGIHEAHELRDNGSSYHGQSVFKAVANVNEPIFNTLKGVRADDQFKIDQLMIELDGTENKQTLGANAILAVSLAVAQAASKARGLLLYSHINDIAGNPTMTLPMPMMNVLNGGKHADGSTDIQESMIIPKKANTFSEVMQISTEIFQELKALLKETGYSTTVGDEGGFAPSVRAGNSEAFRLLIEATEKAGYQPGSDVVLAIDVAASELYKENGYAFASENKTFNRSELIKWYQELVQKYPIVSIEDGLAEDDWDEYIFQEEL